MKLTPWRKRDEVAPFETNFDDMWSRMFQSFGNGWTNRLPAVFREQGVPALNIEESDNEYAVKLDLPGLKEEDVDVQLMGNHLTISGERKWEDKEEGKEYHRVESQFGSFQRSVMLPEGLRLDPDAVSAKFKRGVLTIKVPKVEPTPSKKIKIGD